jgi:hypothetical protein
VPTAAEVQELVASSHVFSRVRRAWRDYPPQGTSEKTNALSLKDRQEPASTTSTGQYRDTEGSTAPHKICRMSALQLVFPIAFQ